MVTALPAQFTVGPLTWQLGLTMANHGKVQVVFAQDAVNTRPVCEFHTNVPLVQYLLRSRLRESLTRSDADGRRDGGQVDKVPGDR